MPNQHPFSVLTDNDKRPDSVTLSLDCKENDLDNKNRDSVEIKQERLNDAGMCTDDDFHASSQPPLKKLRADVADAESNTTNSGKSRHIFFIFLKPPGRVHEKIDKLQDIVSELGPLNSS